MAAFAGGLLGRQQFDAVVGNQVGAAQACCVRAADGEGAVLPASAGNQCGVAAGVDLAALGLGAVAVLGWGVFLLAVGDGDADAAGWVLAGGALGDGLGGLPA